MRRVFGVSIFTALFCTGVGLYVGLIGGLLAQALPPAVLSDKTGYFAGETVAITGSGFAADEVVTLQVTHTDGTAEADAGHAPFTVTADATGAFSASWTLSDDRKGHNFALRAVGTTTPALAPVAFNRIATVGTSQNDYQPGDTAVISGAGFRPGETVTLLVEHSNGNNSGAGHEPFASVADENGRIDTTWYVNPDDSESSLFRLTAAGDDSGLIATTTFTDVLVTIVDDGGPDDEPGQKDLSQMSVDVGSTAVGLTWNWDDTDAGSLGGNTVDACALVDTDQDGLANYAFCVSVDGSPAQWISNRLFSCNDTEGDRCAGPTPIPTFTSTSTASVVGDSDPFRTLAAHQGSNDCDANAAASNPLGCNRADTVANVTLQLADVGGATVAKLLNVCTTPSNQPNSDPSDCVVAPNSGFLTIVKNATPSDSTAFIFSLGAGQESANGTTSWTINGSGSTAQFTFAPGTSYDLTEAIPAGWKLTNVACAIQTATPESTGTPAAPPVVLGPASAGVTNFEIRTGLETICTFTDVKQSGTIRVVKQTTTGTGTFTFTPVGFNSGNTFQLSTIAEGAPGVSSTFGSLAAGTYSVSEQQAADDGWDLNTSTCTSTQQGDTSTPASISLQDDETVTCTFVNVQDLAEVSGQIIVVKQTLPDGASQSFAFTASYDADGFSLTDGQQNDTGFTVAPGIHSVSETVPSGWDLTDTTCVSSLGGSEVASAIDLAAGETVTCTFTNEQDAVIIVAKETAPDGDPTSFTFTASYDGDGFSLSDGQTNNSGDLSPGTYSVSETVPAGWDLASATCSDGSTPATISLQAGETVTCTFTNEKDAAIIVAKQTNPDGDPTSFTFTASYDADGFSLSDGQTNDSGDLSPGTYSVAETVPTGWDLTSATCSDGSAPGSISLQAGETVTCTFTNEKDAVIIVAKETEPNGDITSFTFAASYDADGFSLSDGQTNNSGDLDPGSYSVSETVPAGWDQTSATCSDGSPINAIALAAGETVTCTFTNTKLPKLTVTKLVVNDGGGTKTLADFPLFVDGNGVTSGVQIVSTVGPHVVSETGHLDYTSAITGDCAVNGNITLAAGDVKSCTITNTFRRPKLTVTKVVINNNGGSLLPANFPLFVDALGVTSGVQILSSVGAHTVSETGNAGYTAIIGGDCAANGSVTLAAGDVKSCTITNDDRAPSLTLNKVVVNDSGRNSPESAWTLTADGVVTDLTGPGAAGPADVVSGPTFMAGTYTLLESGPGGYSASAWSCTGVTPSGNQITLALGQTATCTITNNDLPYTLVTSSSLCTFDRDPSTPEDEFRLLFTPDHQAPGYKQNASNPGQFYYNAFYTGTPGTTYTLSLIIPYPFVTQGARPVHVYDGATLAPSGGEQCITPATGVPITSVVGAPFALPAYGGGAHDLSDFARTHEVDVTFVMPATGTAYVNIHLDYGLKGTTGYGKDGSNNAVPNGLIAPILIPDLQEYQFLVSDGTNTWDPSVYSKNEFKKNPGIGGLLATVAKNSGGEVTKWEPVGAGMTLDFFNAANQKVGSTTTDVDGYYMWSFKHTGKAQTYTVKVKTAGNPTQVITIKANGFGYLTFELPSS